MADKTAIEWTDATWNPTTGCTQVSPGCDHCYALTLSERFRGVPGHYFENGFDVQLRPDKLDQPLRWKKPRRIFVNSMSDLFHDDIPDEYIAKVFAVMAAAHQHTFQLLTKRHGRMRSLLNNLGFQAMVASEFLYGDLIPDTALTPGPWPLPNVWVGVSVENQQWADIRIPALIDTPAGVRFLSCEPLLGPVDLSAHLPASQSWHHADYGTQYDVETLIDWVIVGGESGRGARPMDPAWARGIRDDCTSNNIAFHFKQWGAYGPDGRLRPKHDNGRELDGRTWDEFPEVAHAQGH